MSTEEELAAIGRLVKDSAESKKKVALLRNEISRAVNAHRAVAAAIDAILSIGNGTVEIASPGARSITPEERLKAALQDVSEPDKLQRMCADYAAEVSRSNELQARVIQLGA